MLFGNKMEAFFDIWSIEHLMMGIILAFILNKFFSNKKENLLWLLLISFCWECCEHYLEEGLLGIKIQNWFAGTEYWGNRLIGDNLVLVLGYCIYKKYPKSIYFSVFLSVIFLLLHIYCSSSMDIQKNLF